MTREEVMEIVEREDVKFIRLAYFDVRGSSIMCPSCLTGCREHSKRELRWTVPAFPDLEKRQNRISISFRIQRL